MMKHRRRNGTHKYTVSPTLPLSLSTSEQLADSPEPAKLGNTSASHFSHTHHSSLFPIVGTRAHTYLELNLRLRDVNLATTSSGNLLRLRDLVSYGLGAEVLERVTLDSVDAEAGVGLHGREATRHCTNILLVAVYMSCCSSRCCLRRSCPYPQRHMLLSALSMI